MISDLTTCTPREIDSALADLLRQEYRQSGRLATAVDSVHHAANDRRTYGRGRSRWGMSDQAAVDKAQRIANSDQTYIGQAAAQYLQKLAHEQAELARIRTESKTLNDEYIRRGRWTRAFLVTNGNGHVHSSMSCSTCNRGGQSTQFQWLVEFSDHDESEVVAAAGWRACTVCYPSAPVGDEKSLPTSIFSEDDKARAAARADREAAKAKRQSDKIAKALTEDGSEFVVSWTDRDRQRTESFKTERAAVQWYLDSIVGVYIYGGGDEKRPALAAIEEAIAHKHQKTLDQVHNEMAAKVAAKRKRDGLA
jgi:hypothetical protein